MTTIIIYPTFGTPLVVKADSIHDAVTKCDYGHEEIEYVKEVLTTKTYILTSTWIQATQSNRVMENV